MDVSNESSSGDHQDDIPDVSEDKGSEEGYEAGSDVSGGRSVRGGRGGRRERGDGRRGGGGGDGRGGGRGKGSMSDAISMRPRRTARNNLAEVTKAIDRVDFSRLGITAKGPQTTVTRPREGTPRGRGKRGAGAAKGNRGSGKGDGKDDLFCAVKNGKASLHLVVGEWVDSYEADSKAALLNLMQFFVSSCGSKGRFTEEMLAELEKRDVTEELDHFDDSGSYPLVASGQVWKKFQQNFCEVIGLLVKQCQNAIIYDEVLMETTILLLQQLSNSEIRAFRHTATLAAMKLTSALTDVAVVVSGNLDTHNRLFEAESEGSGSSERLESLQARGKELEENIEALERLLEFMMGNFFMKRTKDVMPEIRSLCLGDVGQWMSKYDVFFLNHDYLKYVGWSLNDPVADVRLKALKALQPLYATEQCSRKIGDFTNKFKFRIAEMSMDKDFDVAVEAVNLGCRILTEEDFGLDGEARGFYKLVFSPQRPVALAVGKGINERHFLPASDDSQNKESNAALICKLVCFFKQSEEEIAACSYMVDSIMDSNPLLLTDWKSMTDLLLQAPDLDDELEEGEEDILIEIMLCCIQQTVTGESPEGRVPPRKATTAKEVKQRQVDAEAMTVHFIETLPILLKKFFTDAESVARLLEIPQSFACEVYTTSREERSLDKLLALIEKIVHHHFEERVLEAAAVTLDHLCNDEKTISSRCKVTRSKLLDKIADDLKVTISEYMKCLKRQETPNDDDNFKLVTVLTKAEAFSKCNNMAAYDVWESMFDIILVGKEDLANTDETIPAAAVEAAIVACYFGLIWDSNQNGHATVQNCLNRYVDVAKHFLSHEATDFGVKKEAFISLSDLLVFFKPTGPVTLKPDPSLHHAMNKVVMEHVFVRQASDAMEEDESDDVELDEKRSLLEAFCKLFVLNIFPSKLAADVFRHYATFNDEFGDIIKATLGKMKEANMVNYAKTLVHALILQFKEVQRIEGKEQVNRLSAEFHEIKDLAKRFSMTFGLGPLKNREAAAQMNREGILFATALNSGAAGLSSSGLADGRTLPHPNLDFLEVLTEFVNKLMKPDKRVVLAYLDKRVEGAQKEGNGEDWEPLRHYRNCLLDIKVAAAAAPAKKQKELSDDEEISDE